MLRTTANAVVSLCDYMMGYHGTIINQLAGAATVTFATTAAILAMFLVLC